jgi:regulation of enolase protein 1 (concanavalin A-like superfamily)
MRHGLLTLAALFVAVSTAQADVVTLAWDPNPPTESVAGYRLAYGTAPGIYTTTVDVGNVTTWPLTLAPGVRYYFAVLAYDVAGGMSAYSIELAEDVGVVLPPWPPPWTASDIGAPGIAGSSTVAGGVFTVVGAGVDIWGPADQFQFLAQPLTGDGEIVAKVESLGNTDPWAKAGVMIREDGTAGARNVLVYVSPGVGLITSRRLAPNGATTSSSGALVAGTAPYWVRLVRSGNTFTSYSSAVGATWIQLGSVAVPMAATVRVGLAVTSDAPAVTTTAIFSNVSVLAGAGLRPPAPAPTFRVVR